MSPLQWRRAHRRERRTSHLRTHRQGEKHRELTRTIRSRSRLTPPGTITIGGATAAGAAISGRVSNGKGRGVANARVIITNSTGQIVQTARTNAFGYYAAAEVQAGETYIVSVESKQYKFGTRLVTVAQDVDGIDFTAQP